MKNSIKIYQGQHIFAALTGMVRPSANPKTGDMLQLAILPNRHTPTDSIKGKSDRAQCGDCPLSANTTGASSCYVNPMAYNSIWHVTQPYLANWPTSIPEKPVRLGSYGDPGKLPLDVLDRLTTGGRTHTGYTHQYHKISAKYSRYLMASVDKHNSKRKAIDLGYRTFRILGRSDTLESDEILCPNFTHKIQCSDCGLCNGAGAAKNIAVPVHGAPNKVASYDR
jgi:hypothetical protein